MKSYLEKVWNKRGLDFVRVREDRVHREADDLVQLTVENRTARQLPYHLQQLKAVYFEIIKNNVRFSEEKN